MIFVYCLLIAFLLIPLPVMIREGKYLSDNSLSPSSTLPIKGFFVVLVYCRHFRQYIELSPSFADKAFAIIDTYCGQLIVTLFLFYSGFGIYESIKKKEDYIKGFLKRRLMPVWINFAVCISLFLIFDLITGREYDLSTILLSFTGWTSIGNSIWFMFVTFVLYILVFVVFTAVRTNERGG